jgi:hypothetical protein
MNSQIPQGAKAAVLRLSDKLSTLALVLRETADALVEASHALQSDQERRAASTVKTARRMEPVREGLSPRDLQTTQGLLPLNLETRINVDTRTAAFHLNRKEQTLRGWACLENGPIRPLRINGRLAWPVIELQRTCDALRRR